MFDTKLKLRYLILDLKIMTFEKSGSIRTQRTTHKLILIDVVEVDEDPVLRLLISNWQWDLKKMEEY